MSELPVFQLPYEYEKGSAHIQVIGLLVPITDCGGSCHALWMSLPFTRIEGVVKPFDLIGRGVAFQCGYYNIDQCSFQPNDYNGGRFSSGVRKVLLDSFDYFSYTQWYLSQRYFDLPPTYQQWRSMKVSTDEDVSSVRILSTWPEIVNPVTFKWV